ncbi:MAG: hypothetical protein R3Y46_05690 [Opitutales bacterium]
MQFPNTPITIIEKLTQPEKREVWNGAWRNFFTIYHAPIKVMVLNSFNQKRWYDVSPSALEDVISAVIISLNKVFNENKFDINRTKFRFFLKRICHNRTMDYMRKHYSDRMLVESTLSFDNEEDDELDLKEIVGTDEMQEELEKSEIIALQNSMLLDLYETLRKDFSPQSCIAFEMVKLQGIAVRDVAKELGMLPVDISQSIFKISKSLRENAKKHKLYQYLKD